MDLPSTKKDFEVGDLKGVFRVESNNLKVFYKDKLISDGVVSGNNLEESLIIIQTIMNYMNKNIDRYI